MKKIINGKMYNTETASLIGEYNYSTPQDFKHFDENLYKKTNGEYFLHGEGGPLSKYCIQIANNEFSGSECIRLLSKERAQNWAEEYCTVDEYVAEFGEPEE